MSDRKSHKGCPPRSSAAAVPAVEGVCTSSSTAPLAISANSPRASLHGGEQPAALTLVIRAIPVVILPSAVLALRVHFSTCVVGWVC